jgi:preprotein translocase subunit SecA
MLLLLKLFFKNISLFIKHLNNAQYLLQVATGEGKSTITCILAIINALRGKTVDVITSSPVLAERDAMEKAQLYRFFNLTCTANNDKNTYIKGKKECYDAEVVYGEMAQFQFDILRDNYNQLGTLGNRQFQQVAIIDEVDSLLIDDSSKIARLSTTVPGMDHFQPIYVFLWNRLDSIRRQFIMFGDKMYFLRGKVGFQNDKMIMQYANENGEIMQIEDLENYIENETDGRGDGNVCILVEDFDEFLREELENHLEEQLKEVFIPSNFDELVKKQKPKWVNNAIEALNYQENIHYVVDVKSGQVKPVDFNSTGIVQSSTVWSDGLHQFLQLKHNLKMTSETLTTNFLSNLGFVDNYERIFGLSGTLGSQTTRNALKEIYKNVDIVNIPSRREKQFYEFKSAITAEGEEEWLKEVVTNVTLETKKGRGCLVICETIEQANLIHQKLKRRICSVKLYTMNGMNQEKEVNNINPGEVIVATNLAGRGTDIRTDKIEKTGGLHVVITFMPNNQRVEDQAFGRTARYEITDAHRYLL